MSPEAFTIHSPCGLVCHPLDVGPEGGGAKDNYICFCFKALCADRSNAKRQTNCKAIDGWRKETNQATIEMQSVYKNVIGT